jgi:hypothetical protein
VTKRKQALEMILEQNRRVNGGVLDLRAWTAVRRAMLKPGVAFDLVHRPYLRDLYAEQAREMVVYKASQMGASELGVSYALYSCDERDATVLYVFPTRTHVTDFSTARIAPALEASEYLSGVVASGGAGDDRRGTDRVTLKRIGDRFLYLRGAQVKPDGRAPQLKSIDADVLVLDEVDEMDQRAPVIAVKRLGASAISEVRWISTPTYPGVGIHAKWLESDQREWFVPCPKCRRFHSLTIDDVVTEWDSLGRPVGWNGQSEGRAFAACRGCGAELDRHAHGSWVAAKPGREIAGFHLSKLFSPTSSLLAIVEALQTVEETKRREAFNQDLGLPYSPRGGRLTKTLLDQCRRDYLHGPVAGEACAAGVDVGSRLHVVIRGPASRTGDRPQRWAGAVEGYKALRNLFLKYNVRRAVIDALPETRAVREFRADYGRGAVWLAYFPNTRIGLKSEEVMQIKEEDGVVNIDRTRAMDEVMAGLLSSSVGEAGLTLPADARDVPEYYEHITNQVRVLEKNAAGQQVARYRELGPDHLSLAELYCLVAGKMPRPATLPKARNLKKSRGWR